MGRASLLLFVFSLAACSNSAPRLRITPAATSMVAHSAPSLSQGDPAAGREAFLKLRCNVCHSVAGEARLAQIPLRDLSRETPEAVANLIVSRTETAPDAVFDEMAMSAAASPMTMRELVDIVAYLRNPRATH